MHMVSLSCANPMPIITSIYAAICALMLIVMTLDVARLRRKHGVALQGLGTNKHLKRAIRVHGNFAEHVPISLLLILLMEQLGLAAVYLHAFGITLLIARLSHCLALKQSSGPTLPRTLGV